MDFIQFFWVLAIEMVVLLGVCRFVVNICDDLTIFIFYKDV